MSGTVFYVLGNGKQVFLLQSLVAEHWWAKRYLARPRVYEISDAEDVVHALRSPAEVREQAEQHVQLTVGSSPTAPARRAGSR